MVFRSAVERQIEILPEALNVASRDDESLVDTLPEIPAAAGLRNRIAHDYDGIANEVVWRLVQANLPSLSDRLNTLLEQHPPESTHL